MLNRNILCQITSFHFYKNTLYIPYHIISYYTLCYIIKLYIYTLYCTRLNYFTIYWIYYVILCYIILYDKISTLHDIFTLHHITVLDHIILNYTISYTKKTNHIELHYKGRLRQWPSRCFFALVECWLCTSRESRVWCKGRLQGGGELVDTSMVNLKEFIII